MNKLVPLAQQPLKQVVAGKGSRYGDSSAGITNGGDLIIFHSRNMPWNRINMVGNSEDIKVEKVLDRVNTVTYLRDLALNPSSVAKSSSSASIVPFTIFNAINILDNPGGVERQFRAINHEQLWYVTNSLRFHNVKM